MEHLGVLAGIAGVFLLACLSPGPVWLVITSTSVGVSRRAGVLTGLGVAGATLVDKRGSPRFLVQSGGGMDVVAPTWSDPFLRSFVPSCSAVFCR